MKPASRVPLLQASILVLLAFVTASNGNGRALKDWLDSATQVSVITEPSVPNSYQQIPVLEEVNEIRQVDEITAAKGATTYNDLVVFSKKSDTPIDPNFESMTNYLPWEVNKATFLRLDHAKWGIWYITAPLSGCDVWIADHKDLEPLTVHINANKLANDPVDNLMYKQKGYQFQP